MSASAVSYTHVECDSCGELRATPTRGSTAARIAAAAEGWKYAEWDVTGLNTYAPRDMRGTLAERKKLQKIMPRQWDSCPKCPMPTGPQQAYEIRKKREAAS